MKLEIEENAYIRKENSIVEEVIDARNAIIIWMFLVLFVQNVIIFIVAIDVIIIDYKRNILELKFNFLNIVIIKL